jgi:ribokinase
MTKPISILGIFVADLTFRTDRMPLKGETFIGNSFKIGPGGKGSNQAVANRRAGAETIFISKIGKDTFGEMAMPLRMELQNPLFSWHHLKFRFLSCSVVWK